ncbi:hypothetical protein DENSPDRAFT_50620 [Dentipellis sp. KUC8613]|nr:hypothetical protein DENSPDRAFT_50620 [Dentipellis sp. KUC8613]
MNPYISPAYSFLPHTALENHPRLPVHHTLVHDDRPVSQPFAPQLPHQSTYSATSLNPFSYPGFEAYNPPDSPHESADKPEPAPTHPYHLMESIARPPRPGTAVLKQIVQYPSGEHPADQIPPASSQVMPQYSISGPLQDVNNAFHDFAPMGTGTKRRRTSSSTVEGSGHSQDEDAQARLAKVQKTVRYSSTAHFKILDCCGGVTSGPGALRKHFSSLKHLCALEKEMPGIKDQVMQKSGYRCSYLCGNIYTRHTSAQRHEKQCPLAHLANMSSQPGSGDSTPYAQTSQPRLPSSPQPSTSSSSSSERGSETASSSSSSSSSFVAASNPPLSFGSGLVHDFHPDVGAPIPNYGSLLTYTHNSFHVGF